LKDVVVRLISEIQEGANRTKLGLKGARKIRSSPSRSSANRTKLGLKVAKEYEAWAIEAERQSNQAGIESLGAAVVL